MRRFVCVAVWSLIWLVGCTTHTAQLPSNQPAQQAHADVVSTPAPSPPLATPTARPAPTPDALPVIYFMDAFGCAACDEMRPIVHGVSKQYEGRVKLVEVNMYTDAGEQRAKALKVRGYPVLVVQDRTGHELLRLFGPQDKERIQSSFAMLTDSQ